MRSRIRTVSTMATNTARHDYKEYIETKQTAKKVGETSILWGLIRTPKLVYREEIIHKGVCSRCYQEEFIPIHGYFKQEEQ